MLIATTYKSKIKSTQFNAMFADSVRLYRRAVEFYINVCLQEWEQVHACKDAHEEQMLCEHLSVPKKKRAVPYNFTKDLYKFPSYLRRAAITEARGTVSSRPNA